MAFYHDNYSYTNFFIGALMGCGDAISQLVIEKEKKSYDWMRTTRFFGIGFVLVVSYL